MFKFFVHIVFILRFSLDQFPSARIASSALTIRLRCVVPIDSRRYSSDSTAGWQATFLAELCRDLGATHLKEPGSGVLDRTFDDLLSPMACF
jgi:hypothetical protein